MCSANFPWVAWIQQIHYEAIRSSSHLSLINIFKKQSGLQYRCRRCLSRGLLFHRQHLRFLLKLSISHTSTSTSTPVSISISSESSIARICFVARIGSDSSTLNPTTAGWVRRCIIRSCLSEYDLAHHLRPPLCESESFKNIPRQLPMCEILWGGKQKVSGVRMSGRMAAYIMFLRIRFNSRKQALFKVIVPPVLRLFWRKNPTLPPLNIHTIFPTFLPHHKPRFFSDKFYS